MLNQPDKDLINRYLNGELSGIELDHFLNRMHDDARFNQEVSFQKLLHAGILISKEQELKKKILDKIKFKKSRIPYALTLIVTFLVVMGFGITLWFYAGTESSIQNKRFLNFPFLFKEKEKKGESKITETKNKTGRHDEKTLGKAGQELTAEEKNDHQPATTPDIQNENLAADHDSMPVSPDEDKDIVIKKDKMLISATLPVNEKQSPESGQADVQNENASLSKEAAEKLNPAAGIPEEEKISSNVMVEFWVSPVNYRGYKMSKSKLILFGIEEPDAIKLYRLNDILYMKYGNDFFRLLNTFDFISYQRLKETDVPLAIRK